MQYAFKLQSTRCLEILHWTITSVSSVGSLGFVSRSSSGRILGALRDMCDSNRHHACSANELPLEALKHSVIRYNCVGNTFGCVLAVSTWCRSGQRGKSRTEMERVWKRMTESTWKYQGCVCVCVCLREREREMSCRQTPLVWTVKSRCRTAASVCVCVCKWMWTCVNGRECVC